MAGTATDEEIAATSEDYKTLLDSLNGKSLADYEKQLEDEMAAVQPDAASATVQ